MSDRNDHSRPSAARRLQRRLKITALDRLIIDAVVDSRQSVAGSLSEADLGKALDEFIKLNGRRHQSWHHAGFRDALFGLETGNDLPAENRERLRWYWEVQGEYQEASAKLSEVFHRYMSNDRVSDAGEILEWVRGYGLDAGDYDSMEGRYCAARGQDTGEAESTTVTEVSVLVVGGDETQERNAHKVQSKVSQLDGSVSVKFIHSGWKSNWSGFLQDVERELPDMHGVVIMRVIRTTLGKQVRKACGKRDVPWRLCGSGGQGRLVEKILEIAKASRV